jgi:hypothetical protein
MCFCFVFISDLGNNEGKDFLVKVEGFVCWWFYLRVYCSMSFMKHSYVILVSYNEIFHPSMIDR